jgi:hypothetical protein
MHFHSRYRIAFLLSLFLIGGNSLVAQVQTPRYNTPIGTNVKGYYEYLPQGYETGTETYPLIVCLHGKGALGNGDAATMPSVLSGGVTHIIDIGKFPVSFTVNGTTHKFIVISPQFVAWQAPQDVDAVIKYAIAHYRVNVKRIYLTGLSMGGGGVWDYAGYNSIASNSLAAIVPVCGSSYPEPEKGRVMAAANLPVWATHNTGDDVVYVYKTNGYIDYINQAPAPVPAAKKTLFNVHGHDAWTTTYSPAYKENGLNIYEWMLQYQRGTLTAGSNSPVCPDSVLQLSASVVTGAAYSWTGPNGFTSTLREPVITPVTAGVAGTYTVTLTKGDSTATAITTVAITTPGTFYRDGDQDGYGTASLTIFSCRPPRGYVTRTGDCNDNNKDVYTGAPELCADGLDNNCNGQIDENIIVNRYYRDSDNDGWGNAGVYKDSCAQPLGFVNNNTDCDDGNPALFPGAIEIRDGVDNNCNGKVDDNAMAGVKVNLFGGTNAYAAADWNNWNVTTSLASGTLKYADGSVSTVAATLSSNYGVTDNGTTYGSGMAPAEVLRYSTTSNTTRTLTISGLSAGRTYNLELYATRNANSGYTTLFTIGAVSVSISTYKNLTNKASYTNVVPDASGKVVVSISNASAYSYLAGFMLTENSLPPASPLDAILMDAEKQTEVLLAEVAKGQAADPSMVSPYSLENTNLKMVPASNWTSGFFPGVLWNLYAYTGKSLWRDRAESGTAKLEQEKYDAGSHDIGFKIYTSFGAGYRLTNDPAYRDVIIQSAKTLATRFNATVGCIRSWDWNTSVWQYPVIIDNMMNLELLFAATRFTGDSSYYKIAVSHADATLKNHYRLDHSSYHVVDYDPLTGAVRKRMTFQGYSDASAWARGQAWGLYGFAMCYRESKNGAYLAQAEKIADYLLKHFKTPADKVPYWDFDVPGIPNEPRDASAAAIIASALYELLRFSPANAASYRLAADNILKSLTDHYRSAVGQNKGFILLHSTGSKPSNSEVDQPLVYADYYYLEALLRKRDVTVEMGSPVNLFPAANAGPDQAITLPVSSVTAKGSGTDADGTIASYSWCKISGPDQFTISSPAAATPVISNLSVGTYAFRLTVTDNSGAIASDDMVVVVKSAVVTTTTKSIKVNLFGGTNPYNNAEWNNWNVKKTLQSGTLKYANGSVSTINTSITKSTIADNGSTYGGTMAPPEVLRHTSQASVGRTLTISGLSTALTYSLELYASRAGTGNSTVFTVNGSGVTINTDNNKSTKATFSGLKANASGQLVISITNLNTYNYLNGFILTETAGTTAATALTGATDTMGEVSGLRELQVQAYPNPSRHYFTLQIRSSSKGTVQLRLIDAIGRLVEVRQGITSNATLTIGHSYRPGVFYAELVQDGKRVILKLVKGSRN